MSIIESVVLVYAIYLSITQVHNLITYYKMGGTTPANVEIGLAIMWGVFYFFRNN